MLQIGTHWQSILGFIIFTNYLAATTFNNIFSTILTETLQIVITINILELRLHTWRGLQICTKTKQNNGLNRHSIEKNIQMPKKHKEKPSGKSKLKSQWDLIWYALELLRLKRQTNQMLVSMNSNRQSHILLLRL